MRKEFLLCAAVAVSMTCVCSKNNSTATETTGPTMVSITGGTFQMGAANLSSEEQPVHSVTVSSFHMDETDVTQAQFKRVMGINPSVFASGPSASKRPVENVTWFDAVLYCNKRSVMDGKDSVYTYSSVSGIPGNGCSDLGNLSMDIAKNGYRLPTEAEWEYACRAGSTTDYYWGQSYPPQTTADTAKISENAWWYYDDDSTNAVAGKTANAGGLYDMSGNVWQWCNDWYGSYSSESQTNPMGASSGLFRVFRGGSWDFGDDDLCAAYRNGGGPTGSCGDLGFRCVRR